MPEGRPSRWAAGTHETNGLAEGAAHEEGLGRWEAAARLYSLTFRASVMDRNLATATDALRGQARVLNHQRRYEEAEELALLSLELAQRNGLTQAAARALNVMGMVRYGLSDWHGARELYSRALDLALDLGDDDLAGLACQNAGVIAHMQGELHDARTLYLESIGSFVRSGSAVNSMMAYNNLGLVSVYLGEWLEAEVYFSRGIEIGERISHSPVLARLYINRAHPLIQIGEIARARATLKDAEKEGSLVGDRATLADVEKFRAMMARMEGRLNDAERLIARAISIGQGESTAFDRAEMVWELGRLREEQGRHQQALDLYLEAAEGFRATGALHHERAVEERREALGG